MPCRHCSPGGPITRAFTFALDSTDEQAAKISRFLGARRKAFNATLDQMKSDVDHYQETGESGTPPSFYALRQRWNAEKDIVCVNPETGEVWW